MLHSGTRGADPLTVPKKLCKISRNNLPPATSVRDQLLQAMKLDIVFVINDRDRS
jgi:hypothetical protein